MLRKFLQPFYTFYVLITFVVSLLAGFPFFLLISLGNSARGRKAIYLIVKYWSRAWLWMIGMPIRVSGAIPPRSKYIIVANHISYMDTIAIFAAIPFYFRALGKHEVAKIPILGLVYRQIVVMVDRENARSRAQSMRSMHHVLKHEACIAIFPEGTFNETGEPLKNFYNGAFRLAVHTHTPILPLVFADMEQRWDYRAWWKLWPGRNRAIFLPPVPVNGQEHNDVEMLKQKVFSQMEQAIKDAGNEKSL